jgi:hypothetical protein
MRHVIGFFVGVVGFAGLLLAADSARADTILDFTKGGNGDLIGDVVANKAQSGSPGDWWEIAAGGVDFSISGIDFTGTAWAYDSTSDTTPTEISLYGDTNPDAGGLGAVPLFNTSYVGSSQDNIWNLQSVKLSFDDITHLKSGTFYNGDHGTTFGSGAEIWISVDGGAWLELALTYNMNLNLWGNTFEFFNPNASAATNDNYRFYVSTLTVEPVPEPATLALFGLGAAGIAAVRRRRGRQAA